MEAGAAADEIIETCFGTDDDRDLWAYYCYHHDIETILEKARELKSRSGSGSGGFQRQSCRARAAPCWAL